jgi:competence protein ComFB
MKVHNLMEEIVSSCLKDLIRRKNITDCDERTFKDISAIALNRLPSKYVVTSQGEMFAKSQLRSQVESDVYRELSYAISKVLNTQRDPMFEKEN